MVFRPWFLAWYKRLSDSFNIFVKSASSGLLTAIPMLTVIFSDKLLNFKSRFSVFRRNKLANSLAWSLYLQGNTIANSSPPSQNA